MKCKGIELPKFYIIMYENINTIIAMKIESKYFFNVANDENTEWQSINSDLIDPLLESIDQSKIDFLKQKIQIADKFAIRLLIIHKQLFNKIPEVFKNIDSELIYPELDVSKLRNKMHLNSFIPLTISEIKNTQAIELIPWKIIYINKLLKANNLSVIIDQWNIIISSQKYIFGNKYELDTSLRLMQLHKAINQIKNDLLTTDTIQNLSQTLDESIINFNFNLPDICIHFELPKYEDYTNINHTNIIQSGLLLIAKLAKIGIINNETDIFNICTNKNELNFKSYNNAILSDIHGIPFDFEQIKNIVNTVYKKPKTSEINTDSLIVFNCFVMYDVIRFMISIKNQKIKDPIIDNIIKDSNIIMAQIFDTKPKFNCNNNLSESIEWIYNKYYGSIPKSNKFIVSKSYDMNKYEFLKYYIYQFDFNKSI